MPSNNNIQIINEIYKTKNRKKKCDDYQWDQFQYYVFKYVENS